MSLALYLARVRSSDLLGHIFRATRYPGGSREAVRTASQRPNEHRPRNPPMTNRLRESAKNHPEACAATKKLPVALGFVTALGKQRTPSSTARKAPMPKANAVRLNHR